MSSFQDLNISSDTLQALSSLGIETPTEIQQQTIPILLQEPVDFIGLAQTGTGKTAAFGIPLVELMEPFQKHIGGLIVVPTRELCLQVANQLDKIAKNKKGLTVVPVYGGAPITQQIKLVKKLPSIVVATPGRLIDLIKRKAIKVHQVEFVVLDEADEMLNMGFQEDINEILKAIKSDRKIWLFSATMPKPIRKLVNTYMESPFEVSVLGTQKVNQNIVHQFIVINHRQKVSALMAFLMSEPTFYGIIFCRTKRSAQELSEKLIDYKIPADTLHGDMTQKQRERVMESFRKTRTKIIAATDVAARGIDVDHLTHIIHFNLPDDLAYYTHRSGRTARAGRKGISLALVTKSELKRIKQLERQLKISFEETALPSKEKIQLKQVQDWAESIMEIDQSKVSDALVDQALEVFNEIEGIDLLAKLIAQLVNQNDGLYIDADKSSYSDNSSKIFIGIGKNDRFNKKTLVELILKNSSLRKSELGAVSMSRRHSVFQVPPKLTKQTIKQLKNLKVKGRKIRVREDQK